MKNQSLQDQLLKAGLINDAKVKQARAEKRKQTKKQRKNKIEVVDEIKQSAQEAKARQIEKDRHLNEQRNQEAKKKQITGQINQLIEINKLPKDDDGLAYNFIDQKKIKVIYISEDIRNKIIAGKLAIVKSESSYEVVDVDIAEKIKQRNEQAVTVLFTEKDERIEDNEYQGYEIPDDLMW